ncbi:hypothetical protein FEI13_02775 [Halomonas urmiana]|uniref:Uncharacterized protein n=1 Tax=Halomonas urmiana TaxID=490901 RepID=A0A5R8MLT5_9GAMM|nr:hypothetical protein [Halomonas urmiana]TLF53043.1 hypothetical protein FEI13_02775 [Halomonas urmiana]
MTPSRWIPLIGWLHGYRRDVLARDLPAAVLISLVGFVESVSVAQTLAPEAPQRRTCPPRSRACAS